ncbi:MAG: TetR/AcrR family transcriptional regulator [Acidimicrobiales bacterium]
MARPRRDENLREAIIEAAEGLLRSTDPGGVTTRALTAAAGVSTGTLFHYFESIDALFLAVARRAAERQRTEFGDPAHDGVDAVIARLFDVDRRDTVLPWLRQRAVGSPELRRALREYDGLVLHQLVDAVTTSADRIGLREDVDLAASIEVVRALAEGFQLRLGSDTLGVEPGRFTKVVGELLSSWTVRSSR